MLSRLREWISQLGYSPHADLSPMQAGLGDSRLWRLHDLHHQIDQVVRLFPAGDVQTATREARAMQTASAHGFPVPAPVHTGMVGDQPALIIDVVPGRTVAAVLDEEPGRAACIGAQLGALLGQLHQIEAPAGLAAEDTWITRGGSVLAPLHPQLQQVPHSNRLLHLDFHPQNVLLDEPDTFGVIDWTNAVPGPPHMDAARTQSIMEAALIGGLFSEASERAVEPFVAGLLAAHETTFGTDPHPELSAAWGMAMTVEDLAQHVAKPGSWVTTGLMERLVAARDARIERARAGSTA